MYRVIKEKGYNANVTVENTETKVNLTIGKVTIAILKILNEAGYLIGADEDIKPTGEWNLEVNKDTAVALSSLALSMKKPIRKQNKSPKKNNKEIDAMDVLLGLAQYN